MRYWNILQNPLFLMRARIRLRQKQLLPWALVVLVVTAFVFFVVYLNAVERGIPRALAAKGTFIPILVIQGIILMFFGTGSVASGMALDRDNGTIDYQRMTPMSPTSKIFGYLFGFPVREYVLFGLTLPFTIAAVWISGLSLKSVFQLYLVFFTTTWLYHMIGMVSGMLTTKPRRASWIAQISVISLYLFMPQLAKLGFTFLGFVTILPTLEGVVLSELVILQKGIQKVQALATLQRWQELQFFDWQIHPTTYTLLIQAALLLTCFVVVYRKWHREENHSFSKLYALGFFAWFQIFLVGSLWPFLLGNKSLSHVMKSFPQLEVQGYSLIVFFLYFLMAGLVTYFLLYIITPQSTTYLQGLRRMKKFQMSRIPFYRDEASSFWYSIAFAAMTSVAYAVLLQLVIKDKRFLPVEPAMYPALYPVLLFFAIALGSHAIREAFGKKGLLLSLFLLWVVPLFVGILLITVWQETTIMRYTIVINPFVALFYGVFFLGAKAGITTANNFFRGDSMLALVNSMLAFHWVVAIVMLFWAAKNRQLLKHKELEREQRRQQKR